MRKIRPGVNYISGPIPPKAWFWQKSVLTVELLSFAQFYDFRDDGHRRIRPQAIKVNPDAPVLIYHGNALGAGRIAGHGIKRVARIAREKTRADDFVQGRLVAGEQVPAIRVLAVVRANFCQHWRRF